MKKIKKISILSEGGRGVCLKVGQSWVKQITGIGVTSGSRRLKYGLAEKRSFYR